MCEKIKSINRFPETKLLINNPFHIVVLSYVMTNISFNQFFILPSTFLLFHLPRPPSMMMCIHHQINQIDELPSQNNIILQESCVDSSGSLVVSCPVESSIMSEVDPSYIQFLPSGFTITSDGKQNENNIQGGNSGNGDVASTSSNTNIGGS